MTIYLDHLFILCRAGAPEAQNLIELGWVEGNANVHPGQGTANRRFFLPEFTIELLYISDAEEAANGAGRALGLPNRSGNSIASPFGLVARLADKDVTPAFPNWRYTPDYFNGAMSFLVGENSSVLEEPLCICMPPELPPRSSVPHEYQNPAWNLSDVNLSVPVKNPTESLSHFASMDKVSIEYGSQHGVTLVFNKGAAGQVVDLSPGLPLSVRY